MAIYDHPAFTPRVSFARLIVWLWHHPFEFTQKAGVLDGARWLEVGQNSW